MTGPELAARRRALSIPRSVVGRALGVDPVTVYRWETGRSAIGGPELRLYTQFLAGEERERATPNP